MEIHEHSYTIVPVNETHHQYECECGSVINYSAHVAEADDNNCATAILCIDCGGTVVETKLHELDANGKCKNCAHVVSTPDEKKGCGGTVSIAAVALVASLGACAIFVEKKRR